MMGDNCIHVGWSRSSQKVDADADSCRSVPIEAKSVNDSTAVMLAVMKDHFTCSQLC